MILGRQSGLGRGLGAIIPPKSSMSQQADTSPATSPDLSARVLLLPLQLIDPNPHQPREHFDHASLEELITSIKEHGVLQPIVVTSTSNGRYELIAGERRLRAAKVAGHETIPALLRSATEQQKLELALIENVQRKDLNPIEEARAYLRLQHEFNLTQDQIGDRVGKSRPQVANIIRLLSLPQEIQDALMQGRISQSNARTLVSLPTDAERHELFNAMLAGNFTVRQTEARVGFKRVRLSSGIDPNLSAFETRLREAFGTKITITRSVKGEGEIKIAFFNKEDLHALIETLTSMHVSERRRTMS